VDENYMAHIDKDKYMVQGFMCALKENIRLSVHTMVLNWMLARLLSIKTKHLKLDTLEGRWSKPRDTPLLYGGID
jgi:hypothetical protein